MTDFNKHVYANQRLFEKFFEQNKESGIRVFVAGGSRSGDDEIYVHEAYNLGMQIVSMDFRLDFGLSSQGIMGAVARGVIDGWNQKNSSGEKSPHPIQGITTDEYFQLYPKDDDLIRKIGKVVVAKTLEERKQKLLKADFVVFAPGGVGTLDELAYDIVAMQDGFLPTKPFIIYNIMGYFHHLLEYLKEISVKEFANPIPFIVVDNSRELEIVFRLLKAYREEYAKGKDTYGRTRQLVYELPYFIKRKKIEKDLTVEEMVEEIRETQQVGSSEARKELVNAIEEAYLEKEIERMYERLAKAGRDTALVSEKLDKLKIRSRSNKGF